MSHLNRSIYAALLLFFVAWVFPAWGQDARSQVPLGEIEHEQLIIHITQLAHQAAWLGVPATEQACRGVLDARSADSLQRGLDRSVGVVIELNPESRVKVDVRLNRLDLLNGKSSDDSQARGWILVKVLNHCGATAPLRISATEEGEVSPKTRWELFSAANERGNDRVAGWQLSGSGVEYGLLQATGPLLGSREVRLRFDVGAGTQDIGFRGEGSLLVRSPRRVP